MAETWFARTAREISAPTGPGAAPTAAQMQRFPGLRTPQFNTSMGYSDPAQESRPRGIFNFEGTWEWLNAPGNNLVDWVLGTVVKPIHTSGAIDDQGNVNWFNAAVVAPAIQANVTGDVGLRTYDSSIRLVNTTVGSAAMGGLGLSSAAIAGDWSKSTNPQFRDGSLTWEEAGQALNPFTNDVTLGQQITTGFFGLARNATQRAIGLVDQEFADEVDLAVQNYIAEDTRQTMLDQAEDPEAQLGGLGSPWLMLDYDFNVFSQWQRKSAYEQWGVGQATSGFLDASWQVFAAPDVIIATGITKARNARLLADLGSESGRVKAADDMAAHAQYRATNGAEGRLTAWGYQAEELASLSGAEMRFHSLAQNSVDPEFVAGVIGRANTPEKAGTAILALAGDKTAQQLLLTQDTILGDMVLLRQEQVADLKKVLDELDNDPLLGRLPRLQANARRVELGVAKKATQEEIRRAEAVLEDTMSYFGSSLRDVRLGNYWDVKSAAQKARRRAARQAGQFDDVIFTVRNPFKSSAVGEATVMRVRGGRPVMVLKSAMQKLGTNRRAGSGNVYLTDDQEFFAELDAILDTSPYIRRKATIRQDSANAPERYMPKRQFVTGEDGKRSLRVQMMDVTTWRNEMRTRALNLSSTRTKSLASARQEFLQELEADIFHGLLAEYNIGYNDVVAILDQFKYARNQVADQVREHGWLKDGDTLVVLDEQLQSMLGETYQFIDMSFVENVLKAMGYGRGPGFAQKMGKPGQVINNVLRGFDMFWRPLALMRLGYTQRNLLEGGLRSMAAFGSLGDSDFARYLSLIGYGVGNTAQNAGTALARRARNMGASLRGQSLGKLRREQSRDYTLLEAQRRQRDTLAKQMESLSTSIARAQAAAKQALLHQRSRAWRAGERNTWDNVQGEVSGRIGEDYVFSDLADEIVVAPENARKFEHGWMGFGSDAINFADRPARTTVRQLANRGLGQDVDGMIIEGVDDFRNPFDEPVGTYLSSRDADAMGAAMGEGNMDTYAELWYKDRVKAAREFSKGGHVLAYANGDGTYTRIRDINGFLRGIADNPNKTPGVVDRVVVLPKGTQVKAVRSTVYGKTLDLRASREAAEQRIGAFRDLKFDDVAIEEGDLDSMVTQVVPLQGKDALARGALSIHEDIFGEAKDLDSLRGVLNDLRALTAAMESDSAIASAVFARLASKQLDPVVVEALEMSGALIKTDQLSRAIKSYTTTTIKAREDLQNEAKRVIEAAWADEIYDGIPEELAVPQWATIAYTGATRVRGDEFTAIQYTDQNLGNLHGVGAPYSSESGYAAGSYIFGEPVGDMAIQMGLDNPFRYLDDEPFGKVISDITRGRRPEGSEPALYVTEPVDPDFFLDLDIDIPLARQEFLDDFVPSDPAQQQMMVNMEFADELIASVFRRAGLDHLVAPGSLDATLEEVYLRADDMHRSAIERGMTDAAEDLATLRKALIYKIQDEYNLEPIMPGWEDAVRAVDDEYQAYLTRTGKIGSITGRRAFADEATSLTDAQRQALKEYGDWQMRRWAWAQKQWVDELMSRDYKGMTHVGGRRVGTAAGEHQVLIWYEPPAVQRVDDVSDLALEALDIQNRINAIKKAYDDAGRLDRFDSIESGVDPATLRTVAQENSRNVNGVPLRAGVADWVGVERIVTAAKELGYGKVLVPNKYAAEGFDTIYLHDPSSGTGMLRSVVDRAIPRYIDEVALADEAVLDMRTAGANLAGSSIETSIWVKAARPEKFGAERFTPAERAHLIRWMEESGKTHVALQGMGRQGDSTVYVTKSDLVNNKGVADEYIVAMGDDEAAEIAQIMAKNDAYLATQKQYADLAARKFRADKKVEELEQTMKVRAAEIGRLGKKGAKKRIGAEGSLGPMGDEYRGIPIADPFDPTQAYAGIQRMRSGADATVARDVQGYTQDVVSGLRATSARRMYKPNEVMYWSALADDVNRLFRNDPVTIRILKGETDEEILAWLKTDRQQQFAVVRDSFPKTSPSVSSADLDAGLAAKRARVEEYLPDRQMWETIAKREVTADELQAALSWREMPSLEGLDWVRTENAWQQFTGSVLKVLGTLPENAVLRHPFYRARFMDEMRRQIDVLGDKDLLTDTIMANMRKKSHSYALKATRETLYTVNRLSTPAYALRFVIPFFPAWESSMKFWARQMWQKPVVAVRYSQLMSAPESAGWAVDEEFNPIEGEEGSSAILNLPQNLFRPGGGWLMVPFGNGDLFGKVAVPKGSLNVILPGEYPWLPGVDPIVAVPLSWIANKQPTMVDTVATWEAWGVPVGDAVVRQLLPFGQQYREKDAIDTALEATLPAGVKRLVTLWRGEGSAEFTATAEEIYRTKMTKWELNDRQGERPDFAQAVEEAGELYKFRAFTSFTAPVSVMPMSEFEFYARESRRLDEKYKDQPDGYRKADDEFIALHGETFFRYTKSLSGSRASGIAPTVGAQQMYMDNEELAGRLARIGEGGKFLPMLTTAASVGEEFSGIVYRAQLNTPISGAPGRFLRGGQNVASLVSGTAAEDAYQRDLGWRKYAQLEDTLQAKTDELGLNNYQQDEGLVQLRRSALQALRVEYPAWGVDYDQRDSGGVRDAVWSAQVMLADKNFMQNHGNEDWVVYLQNYLTARQDIREVLDYRSANGGASTLDASSNEDLRTYWEEEVLPGYFLAPTAPAGWVQLYRRYFQADTMNRVDPVPANLLGGE